MKTTLSTLIAAIILFSGCTDCIEGIGETSEERRTVREFTDIETGSTFNVILRNLQKGEQPYVVVSAQENLLPYVKTKVSGSKLEISSESCLNSTAPITVELFSNAYASVKSSGTGSVTGADMVASSNFSIDNRGTGEVTLSLSTDEVTVENRGTGHVRLKGKTKSLRIDNRGTGNVEAFELNANGAIVDSRGTGKVTLHAMEDLDIKLSGTGNVIYKGNPQNLKQKNSGTGKILRQ